MYTGGAVDKNLRVGMLESFERELYASLEKLRWLELKIVLGRVPENANAIRHAEMAIVELNLHVDDMGYALIRHLHHFRLGPDTSPNRNAVSHPRHVHIVPAYIMMESSSGSDRFIDKHDGNVIGDGINDVTSLAPEPVLLRCELHRFFAGGADENVEQFLRNGHNEV